MSLCGGLFKFLLPILRATLFAVVTVIFCFFWFASVFAYIYLFSFFFYFFIYFVLVIPFGLLFACCANCCNLLLVCCYLLLLLRSMSCQKCPLTKLFIISMYDSCISIITSITYFSCIYIFAIFISDFPLAIDSYIVFVLLSTLASIIVAFVAILISLLFI